jgi:uncharacterized protein YegL
VQQPEELMSEQIPFPSGQPSAAFQPELGLNPEPRLACVLLLDVSGSMARSSIAQLNDGVRAYKDDLTADSLALKRVEVAVVSFGGDVQRVSDFTGAADFHPPALVANGNTPMGAAINQAIDMIQERKNVYKANGLAYFRPWIFMVTDGAPTDEWQSAAQRVKEGEKGKRFVFFAVGVDEANFDILKQISVKPPLRMKDQGWQEMFRWLSASHSGMSHSSPSEQASVKLPPGWASID